MLKVIFTSHALKTLQRLSKKHARQVAGKIELLSTDHTILPVVELKGSE